MIKDGNLKVDPLYTIFENALVNLSDSSTGRDEFVLNVIDEYFTFLRRQKLVVPKALEPAIIEELTSQINTMLTKKIYGFLTLESYHATLTQPQKKKARRRYNHIKRQSKSNG